MFRALAALVAIVVAAWFALDVVQARDLNSASNEIARGSTLTAQQARHVDSLLDTAGVLNPDKQVTLLRSTVDFERGDRAAAVRLALGAARAEPEYAQAWLQLVHVSTGYLAAVALQRIAKLAPPIPASP